MQRLGDSESRRRLKQYTDRWKQTRDVRSLSDAERKDMANTLKRFLLDSQLEDILGEKK